MKERKKGRERKSEGTCQQQTDTTRNIQIISSDWREIKAGG